MHAVLSWWQLPEVRRDESVLKLEPSIEMLVERSPGFIEGYWTHERTRGKSVGFSLLDTAEHAHDLRNAVETHMESREHSAVQLEMIRVQEIIAHVICTSGPSAASLNPADVYVVDQ